MLLLLNVVLLLLSIENAATSPADITGNPLFSHDPHDDVWALHQSNVKRFEYVTWSSVKIHPEANPNQPLRKRSLKTIHIPDKDDSFLLEFDAYESTFCLHMFPSENLLHPNASYQRVTRHGSKVSAISNEIKAYQGYLIAVKNHSDFDNLDVYDYKCEWSDDKKVPKYEDYDEDMDWARFVVRNEDFFTINLRKRDLTGQKAPLFEGRINELPSLSVSCSPGTFTYNNDIYTVTKASSYEKGQKPKDAPVVASNLRDEDTQYSKLVVYRRSDFEVQRTSLTKRSPYEPQVCGTDQLDWNVNGAAEEYLRRKRADNKFEMSFETPVTSMVNLKKRTVVQTGCPTSKKVLYMGVVMDCTYLSLFSSEEDARAKVIANWNVVSQVYNQFFNIYIGLVQIIAMPTCGNENFNQQCSASYTINARLSDFSQWRGTQDNSAGLWHLMSKCKTDPTIGIAWMNMLCQTESFAQTVGGAVQFVSGVAISTSQGTPADIEWMVIAHEIGHNFGASHDCTSDLCVGCNTSPCSRCCPCQDECDCGGQFIMNPTNNVNPLNRKFSFCTQKDVCKKNKDFGTCLEDPGARTVLNGGICGNGVIEGDEECDCGGAETCAPDPCCFANCTLKAGAICDDLSHTCCRNCAVIPAAEKHPCRTSSGECDVPEVCLGDKNCPKDTFKQDGLNCGNATETKCATGACTSRNQQCLSFGRSDITGDCTLFGGQCGMYCRQELGGCVKVASQFRDGTPCGNGGFCYGGICTNPDILGLIIQWITQNQNIAITLFTVGGVLLFICISKCIRRVRSTDKRAELVRQAKLEASELARLEKIQRALQDRRRKEAEALAKRGMGPGPSGNGRGPPGSGIVKQAYI